MLQAVAASWLAERTTAVVGAGKGGSQRGNSVPGSAVLPQTCGTQSCASKHLPGDRLSGVGQDFAIVRGCLAGAGALLLATRTKMMLTRWAVCTAV